MSDTTPVKAAGAGTIDVGGDLTVNRLGFGAMRITANLRDNPGDLSPHPQPAQARVAAAP